MIKWRNSRSAIRFLHASILSFMINIGLTVLLHEAWHAPEELAFAIALMVVHLVNFIALRYYVYDSKGAHAGKQFIIYSGSALRFRGAEYLAFLALHSWFSFDYRAVVLGIIITSAMLKYFWYLLVFEHFPRSRKAVGTTEPLTELGTKTSK